MILRLKQGNEQLVATESKGGAFGQAALLSPYRHTTSAKCREQSQLFILDGLKIREYCYEKPHVGVKVMEGLAQFVANRMYWTNFRMIDTIWT